MIPEDTTHPDVYLPRQQMDSVMNYDKVEVLVHRRRHKKLLFSGEVVKILHRFHKSVIGPCHLISNTQALVKDEARGWGQDIKVKLSADQKVCEGEWLQVQITSWPGDSAGFCGRMQASLGSFPKALGDNIRVLSQNTIPFVFGKESLKEAKAFPPEVPLQEQNKRVSLKHLPFVTIDGKEAKDFDDAVCVVPQKEGYLLYVAIADVSHYVTPKSALDKEAFMRANSTYFPDFVAPMLPAPLSEDLCSLKPHRDRLAFVAQIHFDRQGREQNFRFYEAVICSQRRFTYKEVQALTEQNRKKENPVSVSVAPAVLNNVLSAARLASLLLQYRKKRHFIEIDLPETQLHLDKEGNPLEIVESHRLFSHQLIEELMLAANQAAARFISQQGVPGIYRIHDKPQSEGLKLLESFVHYLGFKLRLSGDQGGDLHKKMSDLIVKCQKHPLLPVLYQFILRSLSQAVYKAERKDHFGLNFKYYTHFTSPIRRYSDLVVHRILKSLLKNKAQKTSPYTKEELQAIATVVSAGEQRSVKAERQIQDIKRARYIKGYLGEEMEGMICSVLRFGFFVRLQQTGVEGLVHRDRLPGRWDFEEVFFRLRSKRTGKCFQVGDRVRVQVAGANISTGQIDFDLIP